MLPLPLSPPYLCRRGPPNSSLAVYWPQYWRSSFSFAPCRHSFCFSRFENNVVSRVTLPAWPGQGYGRHWLFFRALSPICILSVDGRSIVFKVIWIFVYYICILDSLSRCCISTCSVGPIEDCCVMLLLCFPPARKCLVGTFESFLCGFGGFR